MKALNKKHIPEIKDSLSDMKKDLLNTKDKLDLAIQSHQNKSVQASKMAESWLARFYTTRKALMATDKPMAIEALSILAEQAKQYTLAYAAVNEDEDKKQVALTEQRTKIEEAISRIRILEKSKALDSQLRKISSSIELPVIDSAYQELNTRDVSLLVHTATALIELNTGNGAS